MSPGTLPSRTTAVPVGAFAVATCSCPTASLRGVLLLRALLCVCGRSHSFFFWRWGGLCCLLRDWPDHAPTHHRRAGQSAAAVAQALPPTTGRHVGHRVAVFFCVIPLAGVGFRCAGPIVLRTEDVGQQHHATLWDRLTQSTHCVRRFTDLDSWMAPQLLYHTQTHTIRGCLSTLADGLLLPFRGLRDLIALDDSPVEVRVSIAGASIAIEDLHALVRHTWLMLSVCACIPGAYTPGASESQAFSLVARYVLFFFGVGSGLHGHPLVPLEESACLAAAVGILLRGDNRTCVAPVLARIAVVRDTLRRRILQPPEDGSRLRLSLPAEGTVVPGDHGHRGRSPAFSRDPLSPTFDRRSRSREKDWSEAFQTEASVADAAAGVVIGLLPTRQIGGGPAFWERRATTPSAGSCLLLPPPPTTAHHRRRGGGCLQPGARGPACAEQATPVAPTVSGDGCDGGGLT